MIVSHLLLILHKKITVLYLYVWSLKCGKRSQSSRGANTFAWHCTLIWVIFYQRYVAVYILTQMCEEKYIFWIETKKKCFCFKMFALFLLISQENPVVIKYHQKKALFVWKKGRKFQMDTVLHDWVVIIQILRALKAENWSGWEGGLCAQWASG